MVALRSFIAAFAVLVIAGCGGGGNGANSPDFQATLQALFVSPNNSQGSVDVVVGNTQTFTATGTFDAPPGAPAASEDRVVSDVTWASSASNVGGIDGNGLFTAVAPGTTQITASRDGVTSPPVSVRVVLDDPGDGALLLRIDVTPQNSVITQGGTVQLSATGTFQDGVRPVSVTWTSSVPGVAAVSPATGSTTTVTGISPGGPVVIQATAVNNGNVMSGTAAVSVVPAPLPDPVLIGIIIDTNSDGLAPTDPDPANDPPLVVNKGDTTPLAAIGIFSDGNVTSTAPVSVNWSSSATGVATVFPTTGQNTVASALDGGDTNITASATNSQGLLVSQSVSLSVNEGPVLVEMIIQPASPVVPLGRNVTFTALGRFSDDPNGTNLRPIQSQITWTSSVEDVAGVAPVVGGSTSAATRTTGSTTITAVTTNSEGAQVTRATGLTVTRAVIEAIVVLPDQSTIPAGTTQTLVARGRFSNTPAGVIDADLPLVNLPVTWTSSNQSVAATQDTTGPTNVVTGVTASPTPATITAAIINRNNDPVSGNALVTVQAPVLNAVLRVEPGNANIPVFGNQQFTLIGDFSSGEAPIDDSQIDWATSATAIAEANTFGVVTGNSKGTTTLTGTLKTDAFPEAAQRSATASVVVTDQICTTPIRSSPPQPEPDVPNAGPFASGDPFGLCVLCSVMNPENVIDDNPETVATMNTPIGLLTAGTRLRVTLGSTFSPLPPTPTQPGPGFLILQPPGILAEVELLSQITVRTLRNNVEVQSSREDAELLKLDLLGTTLLGDREFGLVSFGATQPFDAIELDFNSGVVTALNTFLVGDACLATTLPPPFVP